MRYNNFTKSRLSIASLLGLFVMSILIGCSREDSYIVAPDHSNGSAVSLSISGSSALTKSGSSSEVSFPTSEFIGKDKAGNSLYLNTKRELWSVDDIDVTTKVTPSTTAVHPLQTTGLGVVVYKQENDSSLPGTWTLLNPTAVGLKASYSAPTWIPSSTINWPNEGNKVHFFVYGPYSDALNSKVSFTATGATQEPRIVDFEVNTNYADQIDLLVANNITSDRTPQTLGLPIGAHRLTLSHALSAIRFKVVVGTPKVESIKIKNVYDKATYNMNTEQWTNHTTNATANEYIISNPTTHTESSDPGYLYLDDVYTLMMLPSIIGGSTPLPSTAFVEIKLEGVTDPIVANISHHEWLAGHSLTYMIDNSAIEPGFTYVIDAVNPTLTYQGGTSTDGKVISYRYPVGTDDSDPSARVAVGWTVEGYYPDATSATNKDFSKRFRNGVNGTFVNSFSPTNGAGSATGEGISVVYPPSILERRDVDNPGAAIDAAIASATPVGTTTPYNLSGYKPTDGTTNENTTQMNNTANTYIINAPGYYRFPVVMGNGVKNGSWNPSAYNPSGFVDYLDRAITVPFLNGTGDEKPTDVVLLWADKSDLIEVVDATAPKNSQPGADINNYVLKNSGSPVASVNGISVIGGNHWVNLHVTATTQGIAHIAVRDARGRYMWSWLIWITDYKLGTGDIACQPLVNTFNESDGRLSIKLMARDLGYVERYSKTTEIYAADTPAYVRLEQSESGQSKVVKLDRPESKFTEYTRGYAPYYQWGRPMPLKGNSTKVGSTEDTYYGGGFFHSVQSNYTAISTTIGSSLGHPHSFLSTSVDNWVTQNVPTTSLWNANSNNVIFSFTDGTDRSVTKTIYDPCPIGYSIPRRNAFSFMYIGNLREYASGQWFSNKWNLQKQEGPLWTTYTNWRATESDAPSANTITFYQNGIRMAASGALGLQGYIYLHTAEKGINSGRGTGMFLNGVDMFVPQNASSAKYGQQVRPMVEQ